MATEEENGGLLDDEDECATCYHGVTQHAVLERSDEGMYVAPCTVPGCTCPDYKEPWG